MLPPSREELHASVRRHPGDRRHARAGGTVRGLPVGRTGRRRDQGRGPERSRPEPRLGNRQGAQPQRDGHLFPHPGLQQALDHARPQNRARPRNPERAGQDRRRVRRELPARRVRGAGARLRGSRQDQPAADLRVVLRVRSRRSARQPDRLRPRDPGHLRHHGGDRHQGRQPDQARRTGGRLLDRHHRRLRAFRGAVPARAHRQGPAHRHGDAGRRDDPDGRRT